MAEAPPKKSATVDQPAVVKKYANRRLYNTATSSYVTLDDISKMVRADAATVALDIVPAKAPPPDMRGADTLAQQVALLNAAVAVPPVGARNTVALVVEAPPQK